MKKLIRSIVCLAVALSGAAICRAQTSVFTYQGKLNDAAAAANGTYQMQFALFPGATAGPQIGSTITFDGTSKPAVQVTNGIFTVQLDFGSSPFTAGADRYLEISVKHTADPGYTTLAPRQQLTASPYSIRTLAAGTADALSSNCVGCVTDPQINGVSGSKVTGTVANATNATTANSATNFSGNLAGDVTGTQSSTVVSSVGGQTSTNVATGTQAANNATSTNTASMIVKRDASGNFAAGTITGSLSGNATTATSATSATTATTATNFSGSLSGDVTGTQSATVVGKLQGKTVASTAPASGQVLKFNGTQWAPGTDNDTTYTAGNGLTLSGTTFNASYAGSAASSATGRTAFGTATTVARSDHSHLGETWTCSSTGCKSLFLESNDTDVNSAGLYGQMNQNAGPSAQGTGVWGVTWSPSDQSSGVFGQAAATTSGAAAKGVWGESNGSGGIAVYGHSVDAGGKAGQFDGNVLISGNLQVVGTLSKGGGSFKIDHPLDPDNKYLYHSFVESPDMMNIYNGNVVTDASGNATITMPAWFEALNRDFRYQLTVIGQFAQAMVAQPIVGNQFGIKTDRPNVQVSWQVTGIRHDRFADDNRIPVEEAKNADEKGKCLYAPACGNQKPIMAVPSTGRTN